MKKARKQRLELDKEQEERDLLETRDDLVEHADALSEMGPEERMREEDWFKEALFRAEEDQWDDPEKDFNH